MKDDSENKQLNSIKITKIFLDTNVLMSYSSQLFNKYKDNPNTKFIICGYVLNELDNHKMSFDESKKYKARQASRDIEANQDKIEYVVRENNFEYNLPLSFDKLSMDNKIIGVLNNLYFSNEEFGKENGIEIFALSNDLLFRQKCRLLGIRCDKFDGDVNGNDEKYNGYKEVCISSDEELAKHYETSENRWGLLNNEFLIIKDKDGNVVDKQRYVEGKGFLQLNSKGFKSIYFGDIKPRDVYQIMAIDSLNNSDFTLLFGKSGSAKTLLSLSWIMHNIQLGKINKAVIVFNSVPLKNNKSQGFYPGDRNQKLLQSSLGGILSSKFGDMTIVESLITQGKLLLIPSAEIRGIEISDSDVIFVTEAQNTDIYTMKTIIQRAKGKIIVEGDMLEQQDLTHSNNRDNGMKRVIEVFKGSKYFSCVKLKNRYRHPMGDLADKM